MSPQAEMKILNLYKGQPLKRASYALDVAKSYHSIKVLSLRVKLAPIKIGV